MTSAHPHPDDAQDIFLLPANCATVVAEELRNRLVLAACSGNGTVIDAGAVQTVGQAVLQLLVSARCGAISQGQDFRFAAMSEAFVARVTNARLAEQLGIEMTGEGNAS